MTWFWWLTTRPWGQPSWERGKLRGQGGKFWPRDHVSLEDLTSPVLNVTRNSVAAVRMHRTLHHANILLLSQCQAITVSNIQNFVHKHSYNLLTLFYTLHRLHFNCSQISWLCRKWSNTSTVLTDTTHLTLWHPLLPHGYCYKASCAKPC